MEKNIFKGECKQCHNDQLIRVVIRQYKGIGFLITGKEDVDFAFECTKCHARQGAPNPNELWA